MFYEYKDKYFRKYFCYGIEDKESVLERIIYEALTECHNAFGTLGNLYSVPNKMQLDKFKELSNIHYKQFYRFVIVNDDPKNFEYKTENEDEVVEDTINSKIRTLLKTKEIEEHEIGYFFTREAERKFVEAEDAYRKGNLDKGWTCAIFSSLKRLEKLEEETPGLYQIKWLKAKMARAITRKPPVQEEIKKLLEFCNSKEEISNLKRFLQDRDRERD